MSENVEELFLILCDIINSSSQFENIDNSFRFASSAIGGGYNLYSDDRDDRRIF